MLKGKATIELTNVKTNDKQVIEKTNMVTNAVNKFAKMSLCSGYGAYTFPISTKMLGGLMIFDAPLTESVDNIQFPGTAKLIGYAGQNANTSNILRGSINSIESGAITNGYKNVWDFGTSQANGTINSLSLTYNDNQNICNPFWGFSASVSIDGFYLTHPESGINSFWIIGIYNNKAIGCTVTTSVGTNDITYVIKFYSSYCSFTSFKVNYKYKNNNGWVLETTKTVLVPRAKFNLTSAYPYYNITDGHDGYAYMPFMMNNSTGDGYFCYYRFKISDFSFDVEGLFEITCSGLHFNNGGGIDQWGILINCGKALIKGYGESNVNTSRYNYIVDLSNGNAITIDFGEGYFSEPVRFKSFKNGVWSGVLTQLVSSGVWNFQEVLIYPDGTIIKDSVYNTGYEPEYRGSRSYTSNFPDILMSKHEYNYNFYPVNNYLGTICNLASPVVKTNEQTMKITYTLTDA